MTTSYSGIILLLTLSLINLCFGGEDGTCPEDHGVQSNKCMKDSGLEPIGGSLHTFLTDPKKAKELCDSGKIQKAVDCLDKIYKACSSHDGAMATLSLTVNVDGWRAASKRLCDNVEVLRKNVACLDKDQEETNMCVNAKISAFEGEKQSTVMTSGPLDTTSLMGIACTYARQILVCVKTPMTRNCPGEVLKLVSDVLELLLPPACQPNLPSKVDSNDKGYATISDNKGGNSCQTVKPFSVIGLLFIISLCFLF